MSENDIQKILIIRLSALGDTIHTLPAVYELRQKYPEAQIDWVVEDKASKFVENNPLVNNVFVINKKERNLKSFINLIKKLRNEEYDIALDFQQLLKSALILYFCGAQRRIMLDGGREFSFLFANEIVQTGRKLFDLNYHVVKRNLDLVKALDCDSDEIKFVIPDFSGENFDKTLMKNLERNKKTLVFAPATTWDNKHWSVDGWRDLINEFRNVCNIIITASEKDVELVSAITEGFEDVIDLTGKTSLGDLVYIYKNADIVISPDSGSAHVAWASGAKSILTLFFATCAKRTAPFGKNYFSISSKCDCSPCMKKKCKFNTNECITSIKSEEVINKIKNILYLISTSELR